MAFVPNEVSLAAFAVEELKESSLPEAGQLLALLCSHPDPDTWLRQPCFYLGESPALFLFGGTDQKERLHHALVSLEVSMI